MGPAKRTEERHTCFTYLLCCADGSYYCGWTVDLDRRLAMHKRGKGARYTRSRLPVKLVYYEEFACRRDAMRREHQLKKMNRGKKEILVERKN